MSEAPKKIWVDVLEREIATWEFEKSTPYIRADIVDELVRALNGVIAWDKTRNFLIPYCVRDPIHAALAKLEESHE